MARTFIIAGKGQEAQLYAGSHGLTKDDWVWVSDVGILEFLRRAPDEPDRLILTGSFATGRSDARQLLEYIRDQHIPFQHEPELFAE